MSDIDSNNSTERRLEDTEDMMGCFKASLTVEASFIMVIAMGILVALFLLMFTAYHENVDFITTMMRDYSVDSVEEFRAFCAFKQFELMGGE